MPLNIALTQASPNNYMKGREWNGKSYKPEMVILHWIVGDLPAADAQFISNTQSRVSAHYGIGDDVIHKYVSEHDTAYHAGNFDINLKSIGIEHKGGPNIPISENTIETSVALVFDICKRWGIPADAAHIRRHRDIVATQCPGTLPVERIIKEVNDLLNPPVLIQTVSLEHKAASLDVIGHHLGYPQEDIDRNGFGEVAVNKIKTFQTPTTTPVVGVEAPMVPTPPVDSLPAMEQAKVNLFISLFNKVFGKGGGN